MVMRRELLGGAAMAITGSVAGCSSIPFLGSEPLEATASQAVVPESVRNETGYREKSVSERVIEQTFEVSGQTQDVIVTNWQAEYEKSVDLSDAGLSTGEEVRGAVFTVVSTPQVSVFGQTLNPIDEMNTSELVQQFQGNYEGFSNLQQVGESGATVAGQSTTAGEFRGEAQLSEVGGTVELTLHVTEAVELGGDFVVTVGGYPQILQATEREQIFTLMEAVEHQG